MGVSKKQKPLKGKGKSTPDIDDPSQNPLLHIENKRGFSIETNNLLEDPSSMIYNDYLNFDLNKDTDHFEIENLNNDTKILVILRYFEYLCIAKLSFEYIMPLLHSGLIMKDIFMMIKHSLKIN